jgi:hypothetical protein
MAEPRISALNRNGVSRDIGTLWTLKRAESTARCVLLATAGGVELRVLLDGTILRAERSDNHQQAFELAERWRGRMMDRGWVGVRPETSGPAI